MKVTLVLLAVIVAFCFTGRSVADAKTAPAALGDAPYQVSIWQMYESVLTNENKTVFVCAGALISNEWVLTTVRCLDSAENGKAIVRLAAGHLNNNNDSGVIFHDVVETHRHDDYDTWTHLHDIAMIKVSPGFVESANVKPVSVRQTPAPLETSCTISGWKQGYEATLEVLKVNQVRHVNKTNCSFMFVDAEVYETLICAGIPRNEEEAECNVGELGGPLVCEGQLTGLWSDPIAMCYTPTPSVYLEMSTYFPWVNYIMAGVLTTTTSTTTTTTTPAPTTSTTTTVATSTTSKPINDLAALGDVPYHVAIWQQWKFAGETHITFICAGSLVDKEYVLTSARCIEEARKGDYVVKLSAGHLSNTNQTGITFHEAAEIILHEDYDTWTDTNDIALVKVNPPFEESAVIKPVALRKTPAALGTPCTISGWREDYFVESALLKTNDVARLNKTQCSFSFQEDADDVTTMCAGIPKDDPAAICNVGEDGGPLVCEDQLTGIYSADNSVCVVSHPAVYTDVAHFYEWIVARIPSLGTATTTGVTTGVSEGPGAASTVAVSFLAAITTLATLWICNF